MKKKGQIIDIVINGFVLTVIIIAGIVFVHPNVTLANTYPPEAKTLIFNFSGSGTDPTLISASEAPYTILDFYLGQDAPGGNHLYCNLGFYSNISEDLWYDFTTFREWFQHYPINYVCAGRTQFSDAVGTNAIVSITYINGNINATSSMEKTAFTEITTDSRGNETSHYDPTKALFSISWIVIAFIITALWCWKLLKKS